jgi:hypothetical protein
MLKLAHNKFYKNNNLRYKAMSAVEDPNLERRITFCLYEYWETLAGGSGLPALKNLRRDDIEPFKNNLVLLDLRNSNSPLFQVIGHDLQKDLDEDLTNKPIKEVPRRTMLSRVTDHYMEVLSNRVPIAFEAEFVNRDNEKALYRGILLPFSDDNNNINFILGGVRWILAKDLHLEDGKPSIEELMRNISEGREDGLTPEPDQDAEIIQEEVVETAAEDNVAEEEQIAAEDNLANEAPTEIVEQTTEQEPSLTEDAVKALLDGPEVNTAQDDQPILENEAAEQVVSTEDEADDTAFIEIDDEEPSLAEDIIEELTAETLEPEEPIVEDMNDEALSGSSEENIEPDEAPVGENEIVPEKEKKKSTVIEKAMNFLTPGIKHDEAASYDVTPSNEMEQEAEDISGEIEVEDVVMETTEDIIEETVPQTIDADEVAPETEDVFEIEDPSESDEELADTIMEEAIIEEAPSKDIHIEQNDVIEVAEIEEEIEEEVKEEDVVEIDEKQQSLPQLRTTLNQIVGYINKEDANHNRSRDSLYNILTAIYEFHETCEHSQDAYNEIVKEHDLKVQARAPFTPVLKICLGKDYDKTRLTEYAAALGIARHMNVDISEFHAFIKSFPGGIKGCVKEMRAIRKSGKTGAVTARKTRTIEEAREILRELSPISSFRLKKVIVEKNVDEFCLLLARRDGHTIDILKILDDKFTKLDPILKRTAFIKGNLNVRK